MPKVDEIDFKTGESVAPEAGLTKTTEVKEEPKEEAKVETEEVKTEEKSEDVDSLKEKLKKTEEEKENYKKGMLKYKKYSLSTEKEEAKEPEEDYPEWDENSKKFQKQTISQAEKVAESKVQKAIEKNNETAAITEFLSKNPEANGKWNDIVSNYHPKNGKESINSILKDLDRAYYLTKYESGEVNMEKENKEAKQSVSDISAVSRTTGKNPPKGNALSQDALRMAEKLRVSPDKLAQEDDTLTAEIKF